MVDALRGEAGRRLWQKSKKWYQQNVADLDIPENATLQRAIRRSYLSSLGQTCDQAIAFIRTHQTEGGYLTGHRTKLQALYHKLKRTPPALCTFPLSDEEYQIKLIESIRAHLAAEIKGVKTQNALPDNPADQIFDQLVLWDYTHELSERQLLLQDEVHHFVLDELRNIRGLEVPEALHALMRLGWMREDKHQTFFELICRNFSEEIKHIEGVSEIFNAKPLAMLHEQMTEVLEGMKRMEGQLTTLPTEVGEEVLARISTINFDIFERHS